MNQKEICELESAIESLREAFKMVADDTIKESYRSILVEEAAFRIGRALRNPKTEEERWLAAEAYSLLLRAALEKLPMEHLEMIATLLLQAAARPPAALGMLIWHALRPRS